jgi:predicted carbohydrate-binding protein with CBM5 and CBM33 domain
MKKQVLDFSKSGGEQKILISEEHDGMMIWLGNNEIIRKSAGQVFFNVADAQIESVAVLPQIAMPGSKLIMELHQFDATHKKWGEKIADTEKQVHSSDCEEWLFFGFDKQVLQPGHWYGFKLNCMEGQVAIAEGMHKHGQQGKKSIQWTANSVHDAGHFHHDFHLAYMVASAA